jgi:hypothetical protein
MSSSDSYLQVIEENTPPSSPRTLIGGCSELCEHDSLKSFFEARISNQQIQPKHIAVGGSKQPSRKDITRDGINYNTRHVMIDLSNISILGSSSVKIKIPEITKLLRGSSHGRLYVACSSTKKERPLYCLEFEQLGYTVDVVSRDKSTGKETVVDTCIHAKGLQLVIDRSKDPPGSNTLVLVTGDGNDHDGLTSFPKLVKAAVDNGFQVKIWS